jgi:hypothetical protein
MNEEIGAVAGAIWRVLDANGEMTVAKLKKEVKADGSLFDWAIGWLAREDNITLTRGKRSIFVCLRGREAQRATAA